MGKVVKGRNKPRRNETGVATMAELQAEASANEVMNDDTPRVPLLTKISSPDSSHRVAAFQALSGLVVDDPETKRALSAPATIKRVLEHIADPVIDVQIAAVGTLRNMTQYGEPIVSSELVKNDIFTPLVAVIQKALTDPNGNQDLVSQLLSQSVALLMNLCENSDKALELFSASKILPFFAQFLQPNKYPYDLVVTTGQFFFVITDNNARAVAELVAINGYSSAVRALLLDPSVPLRIRTLLAAIETNIYANDMSALNSHTQLWQVLFQSLNNDYSVEVQKLFSRLATMEAEVVVRAIHSDDAILVDDLPTAAEREKKKISKMERSAAKQQQKQQQPTEAEDDTMMDEDPQEIPEDSEKEKLTKAETEKLQKELELLQENIKAQKLTIEILTNICSDEYVEEQEIMDDADDDEDEDGEYSQPEQDKSEPQTAAGAAGAKSNLIWSSGLYPLVLHLAYPLPPMNTQNNRALENSEWVYNTAKYLREVQERAVSCLGNMLLDTGAKLNIKDPSKPWDCLVAVCAQNPQNIPLLESATNGMWTLLRLFSSNGSTALVPDISAVTGLTQLARAGGEAYANLRATALGILGVIAVIPQFKSDLLEFGRIFLEALPSQNAVCIAESLNSIFDVFAETTHNNIVRSLDMLSILRNYLPMLKLKVKNDKKLLSRDVWNRLDEAKLNLIRFLKYKRNQ